MFTCNRYQIISVILFLVFTALNVQAEDNLLARWQGTYEYQGEGGHTAGGTPIWLKSVLTISSSGLCKVEQDGFQTMDRIICTVKQHKNAIDVLFKSNFGGKIENDYGVIVYKPGERLFSLYPKNKRKAMLTDWGSLKPDFVKRSVGIYFIRKSKRNKDQLQDN